MQDMTIKKKIILTFAVIILMILFIAVYKNTQREYSATRFQNAINSADVKTIEYFLADTVHIEIDGTECCGDLTKTAALEKLKFDGTMQYEFNQNSEMIKKIKSNFPNYFEGHSIGLGREGARMSYRFNAQRRVDFISFFSSASDDANEFTVNANRFVSKNLNYTILYPQSWFVSSLSDMYVQFNNPEEDEDYIVNEEVEAPLALSEKGVWISVKKFVGSERIRESRKIHPLWKIDKEEKVPLSRFQVVKQFVSPTPQYEGGDGPNLNMYVDFTDRTYRFEIIYFNESVYHKQEDVIDKIIGSFQSR